ncbi:MAG: hypothetical protein AB1758_37585, partial [Candidatus Eremiobacterota bacterium]
MALLAAVWLTLLAASRADEVPVRYRVSFPHPSSHYAEVEAVLPTGGRDEVDLMMAVWTPGSYLVREFARHVEAVSAFDPEGRALAVGKVAKNRWRVTTGGAAAVTLRYRVYGREMSVRTNWFEPEFCLLNGAATFLTLGDGASRPHDVRFLPAPGWNGCFTGLSPHPDGQPHHFRAADFHELVDCPVLLGSPDVRT